MRFRPTRVRGRRSWPQRLILSFNVVLVVVSLMVAGLLHYGYEKAGSFPRMALTGVLAEADSSSGEAMNVLIVGTDSAEGLDPDDPVLVGRPESNDLTDSIMILRLDPATNDAALLSIPRDLWVPIAGTDQSSKINTAYSVGGAGALIETIDDYLGIPINHFVAVDFAGFRKVVSAVGGVEVYFPHPARDQRSGLLVPEAGCQLLDPVQALAYSRSRRYEEQINGRWVHDNLYDWGRMQRQQEFTRRAMSRAVDRGARNPMTLNALLDAIDGAVVLDDQLTNRQIIDIAQAFRLFNPESLSSYTLRDVVSDRTIQGQLALELRQAEAGPILDLFRGEVGLDPTPEAVRLRVLNGSGTPSQAGNVAEELRAVNFVVRGTDNLRGDTLDRTEIRFLPGQRASAELLARYLIAEEPRLVEDPTLTVAPIDLVTGADYRGIIEPARDATVSSQAQAATTAGPTATDETTTTSTTVPTTSDPSGTSRSGGDSEPPPPPC